MRVDNWGVYFVNIDVVLSSKLGIVGYKDVVDCF